MSLERGPRGYLILSSKGTSFKENVILHFAAVDYEATVFVNGNKVGTHTGGYDKFSFDVTKYLNKRGANELILFVYDPTDREGNRPIGKQRVVPSHIFYTPCSGIWQTVSLESVPAAEHVTNVDIRSSADGSGESKTPLTLEFHDPKDNRRVIFRTRGSPNKPFQFKFPSPQVGRDVVHTYTGFRTVERKEIDGVQRFVLNGKPVFQFGPLDQGYWPDGLHSPPSYEAMVYDLKYLKNLGVNFVRKHIKVEPDLFYAAADQLGLLLMQDMPALNIAGVNEAEQTEFERQLDILFRHHTGFPSVTSFVIYNEGWGQRRDAPDDVAIKAINETYEIDNTVDIWNYRALKVIEELREQTELFDCNGGVYTQTTDVEGEVNGFLTYDRAYSRVDEEKWKLAIQRLYETFHKKVNGA
ncbi:glycoside hydrolase superfamily [Fomes fomentarius]|nr:glycoside hydrolase superfamily [Fomes fomentarius]